MTIRKGLNKSAHRFSDGGDMDAFQIDLHVCPEITIKGNG
jgi:hypothetical protein